MKNFLKIYLFTTGCIMWCSSLFYAITTKSPDDRWFGRLCLSVGCVGLWAIIKTIEDKDKN